ncbi:hypothetical protein CK203_115411 [Vitis vinifera]|uniref:Retrotransposon gag domain-containing protein n=1 Tax=Vitis vinifera TaxID=29760 RepID=A0A438BSK8_VITVI|nr:hypothetical protein CK203_115411 [Vitis vinifera]
MHPPRMSAPSCIVPPTEQLVIRPYLVPLLPTSMGWKDKAKIWLNSLRPRSIHSWTDLQAEFLKKFYECWGKITWKAINACPHHGFDTWLLVSYFYDGNVLLNEATPRDNVWRRFMSKNPEEAMDFLSPITMRLMEIPTTQVGGIIQISHGRQRNSYQQLDPPSQQTSSLEQAMLISASQHPSHMLRKEEEIKKGKEMEDKESEISEEKKDYDSTMNAIPEKDFKGRNVEEINFSTFFLKHYMGKGD